MDFPPLMRTTLINFHAYSLISLYFVSFLFFSLFSCGYLGQWSIQEPLSPRLATGYSPVGYWLPLSIFVSLPVSFSLIAPIFGVCYQ